MSDNPQGNIANIDNARQQKQAPVAVQKFTNQHRDALLMAVYQMLQHQQHQQAFVVLRAMLLIQPDDQRLLKFASYALVGMGQHAEALKVIEKCLARDEAIDPVVYLIQSWALWGVDRKDEARTQFRRYVEMRNLS